MSHQCNIKRRVRLVITKSESMDLQLPKEVLNCIRQIQFECSSNDANAITVSSSEGSVLNNNYNVTIKNKQGELHLFVKYLLKNQCKYPEEAESYFNNEISFYGEIVECFSKLRNKKGDRIDAPLSCITKCHGVDRENQQFIVLENTIKQGYVALNVKQPLSLECMRSVLVQLGRFHAYSLAANQQNPRAFLSATSKLRETVFHQHIEITYRKLFLHAMHDAIKLAKKSLPQGSIYVRRLCEFALDIFEKMVHLTKGDCEDEQYRVVTHGDLWPNNMLFKLSDDDKTRQEANVIFIDFQGCRYSSPIHDLILALLVGIDQATRERHREDLIRTYHVALCETLEQLGSDPLRLFPYSALQAQIRKYARFAVAMALAGLPLYLDEGSRAFDLEDKLEINADPNMGTLDVSIKRVHARKTMKCKNKMLEVLIDAVNHGWL